jgi:glycosyltransferase involved in cell wall biosynthesis
MKILHINSVYGFGSTGRIVSDIHNSLLKQGHESYVAYGRGTNSSNEKILKIGSKIDNINHLILTRLFDRHGFGSETSTNRFIKQITNIQPDIIHLHNLHGYYINLQVLFDYLKTFNKPIIWTLHDCWSFTGHCAYFDFVSCEKWKTGCSNCPEINSYPKSILLDNSLKNYVIDPKKHLKLARTLLI